MFLRFPDWLSREIGYKWEKLKQRLEQFDIRKWINTNPRIIISITCASILVFLVTTGLLMSEKTLEVQEYEKAWFYDLNTGKLFVASSEPIPPIEAPSGPLPNGEPAGVKAYVFSYVSEPSESERFIGFLETSDLEAKKEKTESIKSRSSGAEQWGQGKLIRRVEDEQWVPANGNEGRAVLRELFLPNEDGEVANYCPPE